MLILTINSTCRGQPNTIIIIIIIIINIIIIIIIIIEKNSNLCYVFRFNV